MGISFQRQERREDLLHSADNYGIHEKERRIFEHILINQLGLQTKSEERSSRSERGCLQWLSQ